MPGNETMRTCLFSNIHGYSHGVAIQFTAIATTIIGSVSAVFSIFGNALVLFVLFKHERLRTPSNLLLGNLCITDFLNGLIVVPTVSIRRMTEAYGNGICIIRIICAYFSYLTVIVSVVTIGMISIDRYLAVMMPFRYQRYVNNKKYVIIIIITWIVLSGYSLLPFLDILTGSQFFRIACTFMALNLAIFLVCYKKISKVVNVHRKKLHRSTVHASIMPESMGNLTAVKRISRFTASTLSSKKDLCPLRVREQQKTNTIAVVVVVTIICYTPLAIVFIMRGIMGDTFELVYLADPWADLVMYLSSMINPIIYCLRAKDIRESLKRVLPLRISYLCRLA